MVGNPGSNRAFPFPMSRTQEYPNNTTSTPYTTPDKWSNSNAPPPFSNWNYNLPPPPPPPAFYDIPPNWNNNNYWLKETRKEEDFKRQISFLNEYLEAFKQQNPTDILLNPNDGQPSIPAHRAILASKSKFFKALPSGHVDAVTLSELNAEELQFLLDYIYTGNLPFDELEKHVYSMYVAAEKYGISHLQELCERYILGSLGIWNVVKIFEFSNAHSNKKMKDKSLKFIVENMKYIACTGEYEDFALNNPRLSVQITKAFITKANADAEGFKAMISSGVTYALDDWHGPPC